MPPDVGSPSSFGGREMPLPSPRPEPPVNRLLESFEEQEMSAHACLQNRLCGPQLNRYVATLHVCCERAFE